MVAREREPIPMDREQAQSRPEEFAELTALHRNLVFSVALGIVRNRQIAEDVTQETLLRAFRAWPEFRGECQARAWLARIATNVAINRITRNRELPGLIPDRVDEADPAHKVEQEEMGTALRVAIAELSPVLRQPLVMFEYEGLRCEDIAQRLSISAGAVRVRLLRARRQLARDMASWA